MDVIIILLLVIGSVAILGLFLLEILSESESKNENENFVKASEINRIIREETEKGKDNIFLIGANIICDDIIMLNSDYFNIVVYHCTFLEDE